jgi:hypothetical protein
MTIEPYYSKEQADALHRLRDAAGGSVFDAAWADLIADIRADMEAGAGARTAQAWALAQRWKALVDEQMNDDRLYWRLRFRLSAESFCARPSEGKPRDEGRNAT